MIYSKGYLARPLDVVLGNPSRLAVLRTLRSSAEGMSGRAVARGAGINHQAAALALKALENAGLVERRVYERLTLWTLNRRRFLVDKLLVPLLEGEARHAEEVVGAVKAGLRDRVDAAFLEGSAARGRHAPGEALELVLLCEPRRRRALNDTLRVLSAEVKGRFGLEIKTSVLTRREARGRVDLRDAWQLLPTEGRPFSSAL